MASAVAALFVHLTKNIFCFHSRHRKRPMRETRITAMNPRRLVILVTMFIAALGASGAEIPVSAPVYGPAEFIQFHPQVASDGDNFLVVWSDLRGSAFSNLYATRVTASGEVLDKTNIRVAERIASASVVWTGRAYLVLIQNGSGLSVARLDRDGKLAAPATALPIQGLFFTEPQQAAASNGSRVVLVYTRSSGLHQFAQFAAVLDAEGQFLESEIPLGSGTNPRLNIASNGSQFLVVRYEQTLDTDPITAIRLDANGHPIDTNPLGIGFGRFPSVASDGSGYVILAAPPATLASNNEVRTVHVGSDGAVGPLVTTPLSGHIDGATSLSWLGSEYVATMAVIGQDQPVVQGLRLNAGGNATSAPFAISQRGAAVAVASNGRRAYSAWTEAGADGSNSDVMGRVLAPTPAGDAVRLDTAASSQRRPAGAYDGTTFLTAWEETQNDISQPRIYISRVTPAGIRLDGSGIRVSNTDAVQRDPHVLYDRTRFVVGWEEGDQILLRRVARDGSFIDASPIAVPNACYSGDFDMATDDGLTVITWIDCESHEVLAIRFDDATATFPDNEPLLLAHPGDNSPGRPRIAFGFDIALIVWEESVSTGSVPEPTLQNDIRGVTVYVPAMLLLEDPFDIAVTEDDERSPAVAWDNQEFLVTYADAVGINGRYVDPFGPLLTDTRVATGAGYDNPSVVWDGVEFVVAFNAAGDVFASRVRRRSDSTVVEGKFALAATSDYESEPAVVLMGTGRVGFLYDRVATEPLYGGVPRVFLRLLENVAPRPRPKR